jgi:hypothetical protein
MNDQQRFYLRTRQTEGEYLVSVCDEELLGETICEGEVELCVNERFYSGELVTLERCLTEMEKATSLNLMGRSIVTAAVEKRFINELSVRWINCQKNGRVAHALLMR